MLEEPESFQILAYDPRFYAEDQLWMNASLENEIFGVNWIKRTDWLLLYSRPYIGFYFNVELTVVGEASQLEDL